MKSPKECITIDEVRNCIDTIDEQIIKLLALRFNYVKATVPFKDKTEAGIIAQERKDAVLKSRRLLAEEQGLNPNIIEDIYKKLIQYFIEEEMRIINK